MVQDKISKFTDEKGWIFHYLGANQDAWSVGQSIGITDKKFTTTYSADDGGFDHAFAQNVAQTKCYRGHQAMKKKGMFTPSLQEMAVPTIDKSSNVSMNLNVSTNSRPVQRKMKKAAPKPVSVESMDTTDIQVQNRIQQSQQNAAQIQQDFNQLYQNSDADMQEALRNSLNQNY